LALPNGVTWEEDQYARVALLQHFGNYVRNWSVLLLSIAIVLFTAVQARDFLIVIVNPPLGPLLFYGTLTVIVLQMPYAVFRIVWHGKLCERAVNAGVIPSNFRPGQNYFCELHDAVVFRRNVPTERMMRFLRLTNNWSSYGWWTIASILGFAAGWWIATVLVKPV
jgi:hypothetical protein